MTKTKLLDGSVDEVKNGLAGLDNTTLDDLLAAEEAGKNRKGVIDALEFAKRGLPVDNGAVAATAFDASGAPAQSVSDIDPSHPAVDADPRANTTAIQNRIDFNDPGKSGVDVVTEQLGMTKAEDAATDTAD